MSTTRAPEAMTCGYACTHTGIEGVHVHSLLLIDDQITANNRAKLEAVAYL